MCTRFYVEPDTDEIREVIIQMQRSGLVRRFEEAGYNILTSGEIRPSNVVPVIATGQSGVKKVFPMRWGFQIPGRSLLVNARSETAAQKPTFREAWKRCRCMIPASWYYEWEHLYDYDTGKIRVGSKYRIRPRDASVTWLCGLYRIEDGLPVFTVLTKEPSAEVARIHNRMPLILPADLADRWIFPGTRPETLLSGALTDMVMEKEV